MVDRRLGVFPGMLLGTGKRIIGEGHIWSDEDLVGDANSIPDLNAAFNSDAIAYLHVIFNEYMGTDIAIRADPGTGEHDTKLPDACAGTDVLCLNV